MNTKIILVILALFSSFFSVAAIAGTVKNPTEISVASYRVQANGNRFSVNVKSGESIFNAAGCTSTSSDRAFYVTQDSSSGSGYDQMLATVMSAKFSNSKLEVWVSDDTCSSNLPVVLLISVN